MVTPHPAYRRLQDYQSRVPGHRDNTRTHYSTLFRWVTKGVPTPAGGRVRLRAVKIGTKWCSTDEWFAEFVAATTAAAVPDAGLSLPPRSPAARDRASAEAAAELKRRGL